MYFDRHHNWTQVPAEPGAGRDTRDKSLALAISSEVICGDYNANPGRGPSRL